MPSRRTMIKMSRLQPPIEQQCVRACRAGLHSKRHEEEQTVPRIMILGSAIIVSAILVLGPQATAQSMPPKSEPFAVLGYLPDYRVANFNVDAARPLTDLVYYAAEPSSNGALNADRIHPAALALLRQVKEKYQIRLHLCVGGGSRSKGFPALAASATARNRLAAETTDFCVNNGFDGVVVDWEHPVTPEELKSHALLLAAMSKSQKPRRLRLAIAMAAWQKILPESIRAVDVVHLMSYDAKGQHSTYDAAEKDITSARENGIPREKLYLGIPFYGRDVTKYDQAMTYAAIVQKYQPAVDVDEIDGMYFNNLRTVERKTRLALTAKLAGVMVWELGQDTGDKTALLPAIRHTIDSGK